MFLDFCVWIYDMLLQHGKSLATPGLYIKMKQINKSSVFATSVLNQYRVYTF